MSVFSVPVTIGVDEERIAKEIEANVEKQVIDTITVEVKRLMGIGRSYFNDAEPLRRMITDEVEKVVSEHENEIVELAAKMLADKMARMKVVREAAGKVAKEV